MIKNANLIIFRIMINSNTFIVIVIYLVQLRIAVLLLAEDSIAKTFVTKWVAAFRAANITTRYSAVSRLIQTMKTTDATSAPNAYEQRENEKNWW